MNILIALLPAFFWGCTPLWTHICSGKPIQQLVGTTYGALVVGILIYLIKQPLMTPSIFWWSFLGGVGWSLGQLAQYRAFINLGVATTSPITAGIQLLGVNFIGVAFFGSWKSAIAKTIGGIAIVLIILGVFLTTRTGKKHQSIKNKKKFIKYVLELIIGTGIGYTACSTLPRIPDASGWSTFPGQTVGMIISAVLIALIFYPRSHAVLSKATFTNVLTGFNSGFGTLSYLISMILNGVSTGFTLSQMTIVVATFIGLVVLREHKSGKSLAYTLSGVALVVLGGVMTGFIH